MSHSPITIRPAGTDELGQLIALLVEDPLGKSREDQRLPPARTYVEAFAAIKADPHQIQVVAALGARLVDILQLTFIPGLSRKSAWRG